MGVTYKGCFTSKKNHNFDQAETSRYMILQYHRSLLSIKSFLKDNNINRFMHRVFYFMHEAELNDVVMRELSGNYRDYDYRYTTEAFNNDQHFSKEKFELSTDFKNGYYFGGNTKKSERGIHFDDVADESNICSCKLCTDPKASNIVKYFKDLDVGERRTHNRYNTKDTLCKLIQAIKTSRLFFKTRLENESMFLKHGVVSQSVALKVWVKIFPRTSVRFDPIRLNCYNKNPKIKEVNSTSINGFGHFNQPTTRKSHWETQALQISPTYFFKVYMKGLARHDVEVGGKKVFIADVKSLPQDKDISTNPNIKLYRAIVYSAYREYVDTHYECVIATYVIKDGEGTIDMNGTARQLEYIPAHVAVSGVSATYADITLAEKKRLGRMMEQKIAKNNLQILNAI